MMRVNYLRNIVIDLIINCIAWVCAYGLYRSISVHFLVAPNMFLMWVLLSLVVSVIFEYLFSVYRMIWRYVSIKDLYTLIKMTLGIVISLVVIAFLVPKYLMLPRVVLCLYAFFLLAGLAGARLLVRVILESRKQHELQNQKILIIGSGDEAEILLRYYKYNHSSNKIIGILDDKGSKCGMEIHGIRVLGPVEQLSEVLESNGVDLAIIATRGGLGKKMSEVYETCKANDVAVRILPSIDAISSGRVRLESAKPVEIEDLLGREPVELINKNLQSRLKGQVVLVTGAGGSIGAELCRQIAMNKPKSLSLVDNSEYHLYLCHAELSKQFPGLDITITLSDVSSFEVMHAWFDKIKPNVVFHAAAYKHVPMLESQVSIAIKNNVFGTQVVADLADQYGVESFVLVSTDKAVNPTNIMGATKRAAEIYCQTKNKASKTNYITVRFGNVLGSNGSVLPLFRKQLADGGPLTVTHPQMTRYFMMIPEAVMLILEAYMLGQGGEIFVLEMGEPIKIVDLAENLITLSGQAPYEDVDIQFTGIRPGEKLFEEIFHDAESMAPTSNAQILIAKCREYESEYVLGKYASLHEYHMKDEAQMLQEMLSLVPEYKKSQKS